MKITIKPDGRMVEMAKQACDVQDACNGTAVSGLLNRVMCELLKQTGTDEVNRHPIVRAIIDKLQHLAGMPQDSGLAHCHCFELSEGKTITIESGGE